jgi:gamma-glutamyltranspeptidase
MAVWLLRRIGQIIPTLLTWPDGGRAALGTGGSERIRSAILCVLARMIDEADDLATMREKIMSAIKTLKLRSTAGAD